MIRSERWNTRKEVAKKVHEASDAHIAVIGRTGKGKSQCCSLRFMLEVLENRESLIMLDPKGEGYLRNGCYIPQDYQQFFLDLRNPRNSQTGWNPLAMPCRLFHSDNPEDHDIACAMISDFWDSAYPYDANANRFWPNAAATYAKGLTYSLIETQPDERVNLENVTVMMEDSEISFGPTTLIKTYYDTLPKESLGKRNLATYVFAPNDTRASIRSVACAGIEIFSRSKGLMQLLSNDTLGIMDIDVERPFALIIITPDETDVYDALAGLLVSQITQHLIRVAQERGGKLPVRVNIILEELGSVGKSIPTLPNLMTAGRSRNIRLMLVLQSSAQLVDVYGKSKAETINSCIGITVGFSTNSWDTLTEWSQRCGEREVEIAGRCVKEPLITAAQLAAMPTGTALIMVDSQSKMIAQLPMNWEMYDHSAWHTPSTIRASEWKPIELLDFKTLVKERKQKQIEEMVAAHTEERDDFAHAIGLPPFLRDRREDSRLRPSGERSELQLDIKALKERIEAKFAALDAKEKEARKKRDEVHDYRVIILDAGKQSSRLARLIASLMNMPFTLVQAKLSEPPMELAFTSKEEAEAFVTAAKKLGANAAVKPI